MSQQEGVIEPMQQIEGTRKKHRIPLLAFFVANTVSMIGDSLTLLAIPWFVLQTTGSITKTGITAFFGTLPTVVSAFFGGAVIDRLGYKRTSVIGDIASGLSVMLIPLLYYAAGLAFWQLLALVFLGGLLKAPGDTARRALMPDLVEKAQMRMERASAASDGIARMAGLLGLPLASVMLTFIGASNLLWIDGTTFAFSAVLIGLVVPSAPLTVRARGESSYLADLRDGLRFIRSDSFILAIIITIMVTNLLDAALFSVITPAYVKHFFGSALALGMLSAALGGSAFLGTILFGIVGHRLPRRLTFAIGFTIGGGTRFFAMALLPFLPLLIVVNAVTGLCIGPINPLITTITYERIPAEMRSRVLGTITAGALLGIPLGVILSGYVVDWVGLRPTILIMGIIYVLTTLSVLVNPALRKMEK